MGNCLKVRHKSQKNLVPDTPDEEDEELSTIDFNVTISKLKVRELKSSILKSEKASVVFRLKEKVITLPQASLEDGILRWSDMHRFSYQTTIRKMNQDKLEIEIISKKPICCTEISMKSIIDGPVPQNISLISNGLIIGRVSFEIEMLEVTKLNVIPTEIYCDLGDKNLGNFSVSIKFAGDFNKESRHSTIVENPSWDFTNPGETPDLSMNVTMKNIRDAALQFRVYKHHKVETELAAECWISFNKLFSGDIQAIYRTESFLESINNNGETRLDYKKLVSSMKKVHFKKIDEPLWLCGRKVGLLNGELKLSGMPTFVQLISGVNTENGYSIQSNVYMNQLSSNKSKETLPKKVVKLMKITNELNESIQYRPGKGGIKYETELQKKKLEMFEKLFEILQSTQKESMISFIYINERSLIKSQEALIQLGNHLVEYSRLVNYDIKPYYFVCLTHLIKRGELDIGYLSVENSDPSLIPLKTTIANEYIKFLYNLVQLSLSRLAFKGVDEATEDFVYTSLAISWFRVTELREKMITVLKEKSYNSIEEWRKTDMDLDDENALDISNIFDWRSFYSKFSSNIKKDALLAELNKDQWKLKFQKRGVVFFKLLQKWTNHIYVQNNSKEILWSSLPGYKILLKAFLIEMKERRIVEYPESLVECAAELLHNSKLINVMVRILFSKTNIYDFTSVQESFRVLNILFVSLFTVRKGLPPTFDSEFFYLGIKISLEDENGLNIARCILFIYNQYHMLKGTLRNKIIKDIIYKNLRKYFFSWCRDVRIITYHLILYRIYSITTFCFEPGTEDKEIDKQLILLFEAKIESFTKDTCKRAQKPYFEKSMLEFAKIKDDYKIWADNLPTVSSKLYGCHDTFPYPPIVIKLSFMDLAETKLEEKW
jgi:Protein of unknown function (DUF1765)